MAVRKRKNNGNLSRVRLYLREARKRRRWSASQYQRRLKPLCAIIITGRQDIIKNSWGVLAFDGFEMLQCAHLELVYTVIYGTRVEEQEHHRPIRLKQMRTEPTLHVINYSNNHNVWPTKKSCFACMTNYRAATVKANDCREKSYDTLHNEWLKNLVSMLRMFR